MLNILRKRAQSTIIQVVVLVIAVVFVFWGVGTNLGNKRSYVAKVNDDEISNQDYQKAYNNAVDNYRVQFGGTIPSGLLETLGIKKQVLDQLVQGVLLKQSGSDMGLTVSDKELQDEIVDTLQRATGIEFFKANGEFDEDRYTDILNRNKMTKKSFEKGLRSDLLKRKAGDAVQTFAVVPESEIQAKLDFTNEEIRLAYFSVQSESFLDEVEVTEEDLASWYEENNQRYLTESQIKLKYLLFSFDDVIDQVEVSDDRLMKNYEQNKEQYRVPEKRHARHILFKVNETDDVDKRAEKKKKAEEILELAKKGDDFAELAKQYSEGPSGPNGGDLGYFKRGAMVPAFDAAVFQLKEGEISDVVETKFGYHIILLEDIQEEKVSLFDEVKDKIAAKIKKEDAKGLASTLATEAFSDIINAQGLENYSKQNNVDIKETDFFAKSNPPGPPVSDAKLLRAAFDLEKGELSSRVETSEGFAILYMEDLKESQVPELESVREKVVADYKKAKSVELAQKRAEEILQDAREKKSLAQVVPSSDDLKESEFIQRKSGGRGLELPVQAVQKAFELSLKKPFPEEPVAQGEKFYVYELVEKRSEGSAVDKDQKQQVENQLSSARKNELLVSWLAHMQNNADIWMNDQVLK